MLGATGIVKNAYKEKWVYSSYGIIFDGVGSLYIGNNFAKNVVAFGVDNSSSSHADNCKNNYFVLGPGPTYGINESFDSSEKKFIINFGKARTKLCLSLHYIGDNS